MASATARHRQLTNKLAVVVGATRGIGLGLVKHLLAKQNTVVATARQVAEAHQLRELQQQWGPQRLRITPLDVAEPASVAAWAQQLAEDGATPHIDVLFNNAGVYQRGLQLADVTPEDFIHVMRVNALGPLLCVQQLHQRGLLGHHHHLQEGQAAASAGGQEREQEAAASSGQPQGSGGAPRRSLVVNVTSVMASHGHEIPSSLGGRYAYRASKAALNAVNKALALDLGPLGVDCVLLHPGYVRTDMNNGNGWIDTDTSVTGMLSVLETKPLLSNCFYAYDGQEIPW